MAQSRAIVGCCCQCSGRLGRSSSPAALLSRFDDELWAPWLRTTDQPSGLRMVVPIKVDENECAFQRMEHAVSDV